MHSFSIFFAVRMFFCRLVAFLVCTAVSGFEILQNLEDLKGKEFGHEYPRHGLLLLHWLSSHVTIDPAGGLLLHFDPARQDYGFQQQNPSLLMDDFLDRTYYFLGSLGSEAVRTKLPPYVTQDFYNAYESPSRDLDRIVLEVQSGSTRKADKVYITHGDEQGWFDDQNRTFEVAPDLFRQVQDLQKSIDLVQALEAHTSSRPDSSKVDPRLQIPRDQLLTHLKHSEKDLQNIFEDLGLRWLLILSGYDVRGRLEIHKKTWSCSTECEGQVKIEVKSTQRGYAKIMWSGIPKNILALKPTLVLFKSDATNEIQTFESVQGQAAGSINTFVALDHGLHPRLVLYNFASEYGFIGLRYSVIWRGPQFDEANRATPTDVAGYNASLQLYTRGGYACARLYIKKSFKDWKDEFGNSWVGFYANHRDLDNQHEHYQWVSEFEKADPKDETNEYLIYEYKSSMSIGPGVQARFLFFTDPRYYLILGWSSATVKAQTVPWEQ